MAVSKKDRIRSARRAARVRHRIRARGSLPRVSVCRSLRHIYAQIIDDAQGITVAHYSTLKMENATGDKKALAHKVGIELAQVAKEKGIERVVFDKGAALYHGRVKALADGLREGGIHI